MVCIQQGRQKSRQQNVTKIMTTLIRFNSSVLCLLLIKMLYLLSISLNLQCQCIQRSEKLYLFLYTTVQIPLHCIQTKLISSNSLEATSRLGTWFSLLDFGVQGFGYQPNSHPAAHSSGMQEKLGKPETRLIHRDKDRRIAY